MNSPSENRVVLSANAHPGVGGQGLNFQHMLEAYSNIYPDNLEFFGQGHFDKIPSKIIGMSPISRLISKIPLLRRLRDIQVESNEVFFDREVSRQLSQCSMFQGATGQCLNSLKKAKSLGARTRLDVITLHGQHYHDILHEECEQFGLRPTFTTKMLHRVLEEYHESDEIRVMSDVSRRLFLKDGFSEKKVFTAHPPLNWDSFPAPDQIQAPPSDRFVVGFAGLLEPAKGFHYLIKAFNQIDDPSARLQLWGNSGSRPVAEYMKKALFDDGRIEVKPGRIRDIGYSQVYGTCSVFVHPSLADGFGYVVAEAMACARPVIVTENTGAADLVEDGVNGFIVPIRDSKAIHEKLELLRESTDLRLSMGLKARKSVENLTLSNFCRELRQSL